VTDKWKSCKPDAASQITASRKVDTVKYACHYSYLHTYMPLTMPCSIFMCHYHVNASNYTTVLAPNLDHRLPRPHHIYILNGMHSRSRRGSCMI
jgi:hypothetical protein